MPKENSKKKITNIYIRILVKLFRIHKRQQKNEAKSVEFRNVTFNEKKYNKKPKNNKTFNLFSQVFFKFAGTTNRKKYKFFSPSKKMGLKKKI